MFGIISPTMTVVAGEDVTLDCQVLQGNPPPTLSWIQGGQVLHSDGHITTTHDGRLTINNVQVGFIFFSCRNSKKI